MCTGYRVQYIKVMDEGDQNATLDKPHALLATKRSTVILSVASIVIVICGILGFLFWRVITPDPMVTEFRAAQTSATFPLYYPKNLPGGYTFEVGSLHISSDLAVFKIAGPQGQSVIVTEQAKPEHFDFNTLSGTEEFATPIGSAYIEDFEIRTTGSIVGKKTWVIINSQPPIGSAVMRLIINSLQTVS